MTYATIQPEQAGIQQAMAPQQQPWQAGQQSSWQIAQQYPLLHQLVANAVQQAMSQQGQHRWSMMAQQHPEMHQMADPWAQLVQHLVSNAVWQAAQQGRHMAMQPWQAGQAWQSQQPWQAWQQAWQQPWQAGQQWSWQIAQQYPLLHQLVANAVQQAISQQGHQPFGGAWSSLSGQQSQVGQQQPMMGAY
ncbi:hypothetical protein Arub01_23000 [Actinomadura rubrobrunea]|uniref:Uncharacterized protein n=1 Tax=Actinomadura rubrobrunea TaxID=115335 RepID=A0A9W6PW28_9ACTN|nr:hypothetical protein [Actinomadura rubrobrunea]GLW64056.1 hypothetical protein Arub01_23000 [Actinomadura rubrobrunea]